MTDTGPTTSIRILGEEYRFRGAAPELLAELAGFVDAKFKELQSSRPGTDWKRLAVMVCMNLAESLHEERRLRGELAHSAREGATRCREALERALDAASLPVIESTPPTAVPAGSARDDKESLSLG
jgi:cell division protein ZapA (FtsZ GTPase activity inhibitor)